MLSVTYALPALQAQNLKGALQDAQQEVGGVCTLLVLPLVNIVAEHLPMHS